jgi:hypothetical protein
MGGGKASRVGGTSLEQVVQYVTASGSRKEHHEMRVGDSTSGKICRGKVNRLRSSAGAVISCVVRRRGGPSGKWKSGYGKEGRESGVERYGVREVLGGREVSEVQVAIGGTSVADVVQY